MCIRDSSYPGGRLCSEPSGVEPKVCHHGRNYQEDYLDEVNPIKTHFGIQSVFKVELHEVVLA